MLGARISRVVAEALSGQDRAIPAAGLPIWQVLDDAFQIASSGIAGRDVG